LLYILLEVISVRSSAIAALWLLPPLLTALFVGLMRWLAPGLKFNQDLERYLLREFFPSGSLFPMTGWAWFFVAVGLVITSLIIAAEDESLWGLVPFLLAVFVLLVPFVTAVWNNDKDNGRYYSRATVFHVRNLNAPPSSLINLLDGAKAGKPGCDRVGDHDVASCVKQDDLARGFTWETRTSSLAAARTAMTNAASPVQGVDVMDPSVTYLYGESANQGRWTAILDGSGKQPTYGVAEWDGTTNTVKVCRFTGSYRFDRAFGGSGRNSLRNLLAERFRSVHYDDKDIWGYCQGEEPVIVVRVQKDLGYANRRVSAPAGVLVLHGSSNGKPKVEYRPKVAPDELPGPVYPITLVRVQRDANAWAAGRGNKKGRAFGFQRSSFKTQEQNSGEYLLRGPDRRLYYVTPLAPRASKSESLIAYGVVRADQVTSGQLNTYDIHVLSDDDPAIVSLPTLNAKAVAYVSGPSSPYPNFLNSGGDLQEFLPLGGDRWRVYGIQNGQTVFYVDLSANGSVQPKTVAPGAGSAPKPAGKQTCATSPKELSDKVLAQCLATLADELRRRNPN
jgi:hypothetical protein